MPRRKTRTGDRDKADVAAITYQPVVKPRVAPRRAGRLADKA